MAAMANFERQSALPRACLVVAVFFYYLSLSSSSSSLSFGLSTQPVQSVRSPNIYRELTLVQCNIDKTNWINTACRTISLCGQVVGFARALHFFCYNFKLVC